MAERGAGRIFPFPPALVAWLSFLEPITKAIHFQGTRPSSDGAYGLARGRGAASLGPHVDQLPGAQGEKDSTLLGISVPRDHLQGRVASLHPRFSPRAWSRQYPPALPAHTSGEESGIYRRKAAIDATEGQTHAHLPERPLPTLPANPG